MKRETLETLLSGDAPGPAQRRKNAQRRRIFAEGVALYHELGGEAGDGHGKATAEAIADRADISVRSFFRYFQTKTDVIYVDVPSSMIDQVALTERLLPHLKPAEAIHAASIIQLTEALNDKDDKARIIRAMTSANFVDRRSSFRIEWRNRLAELIEPHLSEADGSPRVHARAIAGACLEMRDIALEEWARGGGKADLIEVFEAVIGQCKALWASEVPAKIDPMFDRRR